MATAPRAPDDRFADLVGYPFAPNCVGVADPDGNENRGMRKILTNVLRKTVRNSRR